jgi:preprotein translocase subunit SecA
LIEAADSDDRAEGKMIARAMTSALNDFSAYETAKVASILRYSAVREEQRAAVYTKRDDAFRNGVSPDETNRLIENVMWGYVLAAGTGSQDAEKLGTAIRTLYPITLGRDTFAAGLSGGPSSKARTELAEAVVRDALAASAARASDLGPDIAAELKRRIMLSVIDRLWRTQLQDLDDAQYGIGLRTMAGGDPFTEYRRAASRLAEKMWDDLEEQFVGYWFNVGVSVSRVSRDDTDA